MNILRIDEENIVELTAEFLREAVHNCINKNVKPDKIVMTQLQFDHLEAEFISRVVYGANPLPNNKKPSYFMGIKIEITDDKPVGSKFIIGFAKGYFKNGKYNITRI